MPEQTPRELALQFADQMVGAWVGAVRNERGYVHDKWQPTDVEARTEAVLRLAEFLLAKAEAGAEPLRQLVPHAHRASCFDPMDGRPTTRTPVCGFPPDGPTIAKAEAGGVVAAAPHLHRASCDDSIGMLVCGFPPDGPTISSQPPPRPPVVGPLAG